MAVTAYPVVEIKGVLYARWPNDHLQRLRLAQATADVKKLLADIADAIADPTTVTQDLEGDGGTTAFPLTGFDDLTTGDLTVVWAGTFQTDGYTLSAGTLTFDQAPPKYCPVHVRASTAAAQLTALLQAFRDLA